MALAGCALSTTLLNFLFAAIAILMMAKHPAFAAMKIIQRMERFCWKDQKALLKLGIPMGLCFFIEVTGFSLINIFVARFGISHLQAAQQSVSQLASVLYMIPFSFGIGTGAIVAQRIGENRFREAQSIGYKGILVSSALATLAGISIYIFKDSVVRIFTHDPQVISVATSLIIFIAVYQLADAVQTTTAYTLRAYRIAILPTILYALSLWGVGLMGGYVIAFNTTGNSPQALQGPAGFWFANAVSLAVVAVLLLVLFVYVSKQHIREVSTENKEISPV